MAKEHSFWKWCERISSIFGLYPQLAVALSFGGAILGKNIPIIENYGYFGIFVAAILLFFIISLSSFLLSFAFRDAPTQVTPSRRAQATPTINKKWKIAAWISSVVILGVCFALSDKFQVAPNDFEGKLSLPIATPGELKKDLIVGKTVFLSRVPTSKIKVPGLIGKSLQIEGKTFRNCDIYGPAIVSLAGNFVLDGNRLGVKYGFDINSHMLVGEGMSVVGIIPMRDCIFQGCSLIDLGFAGDRARIDSLKKAFSEKATQ